MKKTKKHNIKNISFLALTFSALCLAGCNAVESSNSNVVDEMPQAYVMQKNAIMPKKAYGDSMTINSESTYTYEDWARVAEEVYNIDFENLTTGTKYESTTDFAGTVTTTETLAITNYVVNVANYGSIQITFTWQAQGQNYPETMGVTLTPSTETMTYKSSSSATLTSYPEDFYNALNNIQPQPSMGEQIVDGIESGLGMIGTLASEFLAGFGALFYVNNQLTPFAIFSLVFLGIAITFAIIKLCLNVVRSNTGA